MAKSRDVIQNLSKATGIPQVTLEHTARLLREADGELWPQSGKGGGKSTRHVEPKHLANLILALAAARPSEGPAVVAKLSAANRLEEK